MSAPAVLTRAATPGDYDAIAALHIASWRSAYRGILPDRRLEREIPTLLREAWTPERVGAEDIVLVAEAPGRGGGALVGFVAIRDAPVPLIDNLHVAAAAQGSGIGRRLLAEGASALRRRGRDTAELWVFAANQAALGLYRRLGGAAVDEADKDVFGEPVPSIRVHWPTLTPLIEAGG